MAQRGYILPLAIDDQGGYSLAWPGLLSDTAEGAADFAMAPGRAYQGDPTGGLYDPENKGLDFMLGGGLGLSPSGLLAKAGSAGGAATLEAVRRAIEAWHGTPHRFERFDLGRIGTGEGAQAFGWGGYLAGRRGLGEHYRSTLAGYDEAALYKGQEWDTIAGGGDRITPHTVAVANVLGEIEKGLSPQQAIDRMIAHWQAIAPKGEGQYGAVIEAARALDPTDFSMGKPGALYKVAFDAQPDELLTLDAPLAGQPSGAQETALEVLHRLVSNGQHNAVPVSGMATVRGKAGSFPDAGPVSPHNPADYLARATGTDLQRAAGYAGIKPRELSELLYSNGIRGNQFWDAQSRRVVENIPYLREQAALEEAAGNVDAAAALRRQLADLEAKGAYRNYVFFNDRDVDILERYGLLGGPVLPGGTYDNPDPETEATRAHLRAGGA